MKRNAVTHGIMSTSPVVGAESETDWQCHLDGIIESLGCENHLERKLAERVALLLWRLQRTSRYERDAVTLRQERIEDDVAEALVKERERDSYLDALRSPV